MPKHKLDKPKKTLVKPLWNLKKSRKPIHRKEIIISAVAAGMVTLSTVGLGALTYSSVKEKEEQVSTMKIAPNPPNTSLTSIEGKLEELSHLGLQAALEQKNLQNLENAAAATTDPTISKDVTNVSFETLSLDSLGIPSYALDAYKQAEKYVNTNRPNCGLSWTHLAAIGLVESHHGTYKKNAVTKNGDVKPGIYGIALDGTNNTRVIKDTDGGKYDKDKVYDRAVGPMQFIPSTWETNGVDANNDGKKDPQNMSDATAAAGMYLCSNGKNLNKNGDLYSALLSYNHSTAYVEKVIGISKAYQKGKTPVLENPTPKQEDQKETSKKQEPTKTKQPSTPTSNQPTKTPAPTQPTKTPTPTTPTQPTKTPTPTSNPTVSPTEEPSPEQSEEPLAGLDNLNIITKDQ